MKLSIIIPTYNSASVLPRALDSIICQTFTNWEVLIMDGISTDDTLKMAQSYNDSRIRIYSEPDNGIYDAMNKGINKANGEWLYFLGSDDCLFSKDVLSNIFNHNIYGVEDRNTLIASGKERLSYFSWEKSAKQLKQIYDRLS